jgi:hypothetical protein
VGIALGTPAYMSPEQILNDELDGRSDIYSLGCVLFEMLSGRVPFLGADGRVAIGRRLREEVPLPSGFAPETPQLVDDLVARAMMRWPNDRFSSAREFARALDRAGLVLEPPAVVPVTAPPARVPTPTVRLLTPQPQALRANLGALVSRTCNRWKQVNAFDAFVRSTRQSPQRHTQVCIIHGADGESHESLVARLIGTRIASYAAELAGEEGGAVANLKVPWPDDEHLATAKRDLVISLFREVAPLYMGDDLSVATLVRLASSLVTPVIVVQHDLRASHWNGATEGLLRWYIDQFWGDRSTSERWPLFVVFLKVFYPVAQPGLRLPAWLRRRPPDRQEIAGRVRRFADAGGFRCPTTVLGELTPVNVDDVKTWFDHNNIYDSEKQRHKLATALFGDTEARPLAEVEQQLEQIHREFVQQVAGQQRSLAW